MKITVLGGSPKGERSVTMQYVEYMRRRRPDVDFEIHQPALRIKKLETEAEAFEVIMESVESADGILWAFPLYVHGVCGQFQRFIELIEERDFTESFRGKVAGGLSTSIHFFDNTAHDYIRAVSEDLNMPWAGSHSAHMKDLTSSKGRKSMDGFIETFLWSVTEAPSLRRTFPPKKAGPTVAETLALENKARSLQIDGSKSQPLKAAIISDGNEGLLGGMVTRLSRSLGEENVDVVDLRNISIAGGCMGCLKCGPKNQCAWDGKDDVRSIYDDVIENAQLLIYAAKVKNRWHSALLKIFVDRGFFHTHQPFLSGKHFAVVLEGSLAQNPPLKDYLEAYGEWGGATLVDICASDDVESASALAESLDHLAERCIKFASISHHPPRTFKGVAGMMVFRDEIFSHLRMVFRADHKAYKKSGLYKTMIHKRPLQLIGFRIVGGISALPFVQKRMVSNMREFMLMPYKSLLANTQPMQLDTTSIQPQEKLDPVEMRIESA